MSDIKGSFRLIQIKEGKDDKIDDYWHSIDLRSANGQTICGKEYVGSTTDTGRITCPFCYSHWNYGRFPKKINI